MKHIKKLTIIALIIFVLINCFSVNIFRVYASDEVTWSNMQEKANKFIEVGGGKANGGNSENIFSNLVFLGRVLTTIGAGILVVVAIIMGIKYITATPENMGKLKGQAIGLVVAAFVIFGAYFIWSMILDVVSKF